MAGAELTIGMPIVELESMGETQANTPHVWGRTSSVLAAAYPTCTPIVVLADMAEAAQGIDDG